MLTAGQPGLAPSHLPTAPTSAPLWRLLCVYVLAEAMPVNGLGYIRTRSTAPPGSPADLQRCGRVRHAAPGCRALYPAALVPGQGERSTLVYPLDSISDPWVACLWLAWPARHGTCCQRMCASLLCCGRSVTNCLKRCCTLPLLLLFLPGHAFRRRPAPALGLPAVPALLAPALAPECRPRGSSQRAAAAPRQPGTRAAESQPLGEQPGQQERATSGADRGPVQSVPHHRWHGEGGPAERGWLRRQALVGVGSCGSRTRRCCQQGVLSSEMGWPPHAGGGGWLVPGHPSGPDHGAAGTQWRRQDHHYQHSVRCVYECAV